MYIVISRATTKKPIKRDTVKNTVDRLQWNTKKCSNKLKESREGEIEKQNPERTNRTKNKMVNLNPSVSIIIKNSLQMIGVG